MREHIEMLGTHLVELARLHGGGSKVVYLSANVLPFLVTHVA